VRRGGGVVDEARSQRQPVLIAAVARGCRDHDAGVVYGGVIRGRRSASPRVRDLRRALCHGGVLGRHEVFVGGAIGLHQQDATALADRVRGLDVERDLQAPAFGFCCFFGARRKFASAVFEF